MICVQNCIVCVQGFLLQNSFKECMNKQFAISAGYTAYFGGFHVIDFQIGHCLVLVVFYGV